MRLIVTRPEPDASRTAQALAALGHEPILSPMLDIAFDNEVRVPDRPFQAVLATSANAVRALLAHRDAGRLMRLPLLAVGDSTALEARRGGFRDARSAGGAVDDLAALAAAELDPAAGPLLYVVGDVQSDDLGGHLGALGFRVETTVVYRTEARTRLSNSASAALRRGAADGVLLYSRRSAATFALAVRAEGLAPLSDRIVCFCLSPAVAAPLAAVATGPVRVAERPDQISLFALLETTKASGSASPA